MQPLNIFAIGNPGKNYENTRHNAGIIFVTWISDKLNQSDEPNSILGCFDLHKKTNTSIRQVKSLTSNSKRDLRLVISNSFMNNSGEALQPLINFFDIDSEKDLIIVHDDLDIEIGKNKLAYDRSAAGHNGIIDIIEKLGGQNFMRGRIGIENIENPDRKILPPRDFVLRNFTEDEQLLLEDCFEDLWDKIQKHYSL